LVLLDAREKKGLVSDTPVMLIIIIFMIGHITLLRKRSQLDGQSSFIDQGYVTVSFASSHWVSFHFLFIPAFMKP
jgi:hypothetical protein